MFTKRNYILLLCIPLIATSCYTNEFYFDIDDQSICSCNPKDLKYLSITNMDTNIEYYTIIFDTLAKQPSKVIYINSVDKSYIIHKSYNINKSWKEQIINSDSLRLRPFTHYEIDRTGGDDAASFAIEIWTDKNGKVIKTTKDKCKD